MDIVPGETFDRKGLLNEILVQFQIDRHGHHGLAHWTRVRHHGLAVGRLSGADLHVVELFSFLHDSCRHDEGRDIGHGQRAVDFAVSLNGKYFDLAGARLDVLCKAIMHHSEGAVHADPTVQTCWDADRLDLGRVGVMPDAKFLSAHAIPMINDAYLWSKRSKFFD